MNLLKMGLALCLTLGLMGCPVEDEDTDGSVMMMEGETGTEDPLAGLGADCVCEDGEFICMSTCPEALRCAANTCTIQCTSDDDCPSGFTCQAVAESDFETMEMTNLGLSYCLDI